MDTLTSTRPAAAALERGRLQDPGRGSPMVVEKACRGRLRVPGEHHVTSVVDAPRLVSSDASPTRPEWVVACSTPAALAALAAAWKRSSTILGYRPHSCRNTRVRARLEPSGAHEAGPGAVKTPQGALSGGPRASSPRTWPRARPLGGALRRSGRARPRRTPSDRPSRESSLTTGWVAALEDAHQLPSSRPAEGRASPRSTACPLNAASSVLSDRYGTRNASCSMLLNCSARTCICS